MRLQKFEVTNAEGGTAVLMRITAESATNKITGKDDDIVYVNLKSAKDKDSVDDALQTFIAEKLGISRGKVAIASGRSIEKRIVIVMGLTPEAVESRLL